MKKRLLAISLATIAIGASAAIPMWLRDVKISPDGTQILFTYKGDIYKVATEGGEATRLTALDSYEVARRKNYRISQRPKRRTRHFHDECRWRKSHSHHILI